MHWNSVIASAVKRGLFYAIAGASAVVATLALVWFASQIYEESDQNRRQVEAEDRIDRWIEQQKTNPT